MKKLMFPLLFLSSFCFSQNLLVTELRPHPTFPSHDQVDVFFPGEQLPTEPYVKLAVIELWQAGRYGRGVQVLMAEAARLGYDALLVQGQHRYEPAGLAAVAIKYRQNLPQNISTTYRFFAPDDDEGFAPVGFVTMDGNGQAQDVQVKRIWWDLVNLFSITELLEVPQGWQAERNRQGQLVRKYTSNVFDYKFEYDSNGRLWRAEVKREGQFNTELTFSHDAEGQIIEQLVGKTKFHGPLIFRYDRDANGEVASILVSQVDGRLPIFKVEVGSRDQREQLR